MAAAQGRDVEILQIQLDHFGVLAALMARSGTLLTAWGNGARV
jgi:hypothetical protein